MEHWHERYARALTDAGISAAELARRVGISDSLARKYGKGKVTAPRGDLMARIAAELGVEKLWLSDGVEPMRPGELAERQPGESGDDILHRREMAQRIAGARTRRQIATVESAASGTVISAVRWRKIESGQIAPTPLELRVISERLWCSLDWIVSGHVTPIDDGDPVATAKVRRFMQEENSRLTHEPG